MFALPVTLNCMLSTEDISHVFQVTVPRTARVMELKRAVQAASDVLSHVLPDSLNLWKVLLSFDDMFEQRLKNIKLSDDIKLLPLKQLSEIFPETVDPGLLHIIVGEPFCLMCIFLDKLNKPIFQVSVPIERHVVHLQEKIGSIIKIDPRRIELWKVNIPMDDMPRVLERVQKLNFSADEPLDCAKSLSEIFQEPLSVHFLNIFVRERPPVGVKYTGIEEIKERDVLAQLITRFKSICSSCPSDLTPSVAVKSVQYFTIQGNEKNRIFDGRYNMTQPANTNGPPIQLFNPAFAYFSSMAFDSEYAVPNEFLQDVGGFMAAFAAIHRYEVDRSKYLRPFFEKILGWSTAATANRDKTIPDAVVQSWYGQHPLFLVIGEEKNEFGQGDSDPSIQASFSFRRVVCQKENTWVRERCCFPVFLIAHAGPWFAILGAIITSEFIVQRLTDFIWVPIHSVCNEKQYLRVGRILYALRESVQRLDMWYKAVLPTIERPLPPSRFCPTPDTYLHNSQPVKFTYLKPLEQSPDCVTYLAKTGEGEANRIVVKFVTRYCADAHHAMAAAGFAPKLLYHGLINTMADMPSYGSLRMVVMEYSEGQTLHNAMHHKMSLPGFFSSLRTAVNHLHAQDFVFGDLREPNIIVTPNGSPLLIDFDWVGKEGEATYPPFISPAIEWANGIAALELIRKEHDSEMIEMMETRYEQCL